MGSGPPPGTRVPRALGSRRGPRPRVRATFTGSVRQARAGGIPARPRAGAGADHPPRAGRGDAFLSAPRPHLITLLARGRDRGVSIVVAPSPSSRGAGGESQGPPSSRTGSTHPPRARGGELHDAGKKAGPGSPSSRAGERSRCGRSLGRERDLSGLPPGGDGRAAAGAPRVGGARVSRPLRGRSRRIGPGRNRDAVLPPRGGEPGRPPRARRPAGPGRGGAGGRPGPVISRWTAGRPGRGVAPAEPGISRRPCRRTGAPARWRGGRGRAPPPAPPPRGTGRSGRARRGGRPPIRRTRARCAARSTRGG